MSSTSASELPISVYVLARRKACSFVRAHRMARDDRRDVENELLLHLWAHRHRLDAQRSPVPYANALMENRLRSLLRRISATKRGGWAAFCADGEIGESTPEPSVGCPEASENARVDLGRAVVGLPEAVQRTLELLRSVGPTEAAAIAGVSRSTVYDHIRKIRAAFECAGIGCDYVLCRRGGH